MRIIFQTVVCVLLVSGVAINSYAKNNDQTNKGSEKKVELHKLKEEKKQALEACEKQVGKKNIKKCQKSVKKKYNSKIKELEKK